MYTPFVASDACCRNTASPLSLHTSIGMCSRWQANMLFITGMYWWAESDEPLTDTTKIRLCRRSSSLDAEYRFEGPELDPSAAASLRFAPPCSSAQAIVRRFMWLRARVRAPASIVEVLPCRCDGVVLSIRAWRLRVICSSTRRKGRYLLCRVGVSPIAMSPSVSAFGEG
jgi:hypothetical protein